MRHLGSSAAKGLVALAVVAASSCESSSNDPSPLSLAAFLSGAMDVTCAANVDCGLYPDTATCRTSTAQNAGQIQADVATGIVKYDGVAAAACLFGISLSISPTCRLSDPTSLQPSTCPKVFTGTVADDGPCFTGDECISGECDRSNCATTCCAGTCVPPTQSPSGTIAVGAQLVDDCVQLDEECAAGTACILTTVGAFATVCATPPGEGAPCGGTASCDLRGDFCDPATMTCTPRVAVGGTCVTGGDDCVLYASCDAASMKCAARPRAGDVCSLTSLPCLGGLACIAARCELPAPATVCPPS